LEAANNIRVDAARGKKRPAEAIKNDMWYCIVYNQITSDVWNYQ